jgi:hypothetical protein
MNHNLSDLIIYLFFKIFFRIQAIWQLHFTVFPLGGVVAQFFVFVLSIPAD